ncbi:hypothetical protein S40293_10654 [Stachybotrys chartarum IBT 40293]|nr:hypothetical protein S40293_10654 [Stachybotrys chartarum IBT 40293]
MQKQLNVVPVDVHMTFQHIDWCCVKDNPSDESLDPPWPWLFLHANSEYAASYQTEWLCKQAAPAPENGTKTKPNR